MTDREPFDILKHNDPADDPNLRLTPDEDLLAAILATTPGSQRRARVRYRALIAAVIILTLASIAAAWVLTTRPVETLAVTCYSDTNLESDRHGTVALGGSPSVADCNDAWTLGFISNPRVEPGTIPPLTGCVTDRGVLAVFPTDDAAVCDNLGLAERTPDRPVDQLDSVSQARQQIRDFVQLQSCHTMDDMAQTVRRILDDNGLPDWKVHRQPDYPGRPCGSLAYDIPDRTVTIVPIEHLR